ncbi:MAG: urea ABC transporter substrate-binding protein [Planctomycetaceae bacterium]|jgi:urea transport system substrate-binding protein|nr:urea ABC transporter substrate-binding protein [Planctomycetaceae bacterium]
MSDLVLSPAPAHKPPGRRPAVWRRWNRWLAVAALLGAAAAAWFGLDRLLVNRRPIVVGLLHSRTGPMAVSERSMIDAEVLALEEINAAGGLLGRPVRWVIADGASDPPTFAREAERLVEQRPAVIVGCWTSASRKSVLPVVEAHDHLLIYPMAYEGLEQSPNIVYTGAAPNQQITPAVQWCHDTLGARRFFLVGSDYIWPHCVNAIAADQIKGFGAEVVGEAYVPFGSREVADVVRRIVATAPDVILCSVVGDSGVAFARGLREADVRPEKMPLVTFAMAEDEVRDLPAGDMVGNYASWSYFQSLDRPENQAFVRAFKARYGADRTTADVMAAAYNSVHLWAQAVREAGTADVRQVRTALRHQSRNAPEGIIAVDPETQHTWRPVFIGKIRADGQFDVVWTSRTAVRPVPFPISRSRSEWEAFVADLYRSWGGRWSNPVGAAPDVSGGRR